MPWLRAGVIRVERGWDQCAGEVDVRITLDQYGHLLPGAEDEAAGLLDPFLARQVGGAEVDCSADCTHPAQSRA